MQNLKSISVKAKEWNDTKNGNSYFSAKIIVDHGFKSEQTYKLPFQYGYGSQYEFLTLEKLKDEGVVETNEISLSRFCNDNNIKLSRVKHETTKKEVESFGK